MCLAMRMMNTTLAISEGWMPMPRKRIQALLPVSPDTPKGISSSMMKVSKPSRRIQRSAMMSRSMTVNT